MFFVGVVDSFDHTLNSGVIESIFENTDFTQEEAKALFNQKYPLDSLYQEWLSNDLTYMDQLRETVDDKIKSAVKEMKAKQRESR